MKKFICALLCLTTVLALLVPVLTAGAESEPSALSTATVGGEQFTVMSMNIRYSNSGEGTASLKWVVGTDDQGEYIYRVDNAITEILKVSPDIIGFQEYNFTENTDVDTKLTEALTGAGYGIVMQYYSDGTTHNQTPIFYKTDKFTAVTDTGAQGILQYEHGQVINPVAGTETLHVKVGKSSQATYTKGGTTAGGGSVTELCDSSVRSATGAYYPQTLTDAEIAAGNYLDVTKFHAGGSILNYYTSMGRVTFNDDGTVTYNSGIGKTQTYDGAYHTRQVINATPLASPSKSLTWGVLQHNTSGQRILMMSTHCALYLDGLAKGADDFTYAMAKAWNQENAKDLLETVETVYGSFGRLPTIAVGDFNMGNNQPGYNILSGLFDDSARLAPDAIYWEATSLDMDGVKTLITDESGNAVTDSAGTKLYDVRAYREEKAPTPGYPIDHIFCSEGDLEVLSYNVLNDTPAQRVISDHYALMTTFVLPDVATPACSHKSDIYRLEQSVTLTAGNTSDVIYYTLDGSDPTTSATRATYTGALKLYGDVQLRSAAYRDGQYSPVRTVNFATGAELAITEFIKNNQATHVLLPDGTATTTNGEVFTGFEVVNTSAHSIDLARYVYWHAKASAQGTAGTRAELESLDLDTVSAHMFVPALGTYILEPGKTAFIWVLTSQSYGYQYIYNAAGDAAYAVDFVTVENYEALGYPATAIGKAIYKTDIAKAAFEYATKSTITADLIVPLDPTAADYACNYNAAASAKLSERFQRADAKSAAFHLLSNNFDHYGTYYSRMLVTYGNSKTAANAFTSAIIADQTGTTGFVAGSTFANQGSFYITNTVDQASGRITGVATKHTLQKYGLGVLETEEATLAANLVRDLSKRAVTWSVNGAETTEYVLRNAVPAFTGDTSKPSSATQHFTFTGWSPAPAACAVDSTGTYLLATEVTYVAQYSATDYAGAVTFLDASGAVCATVAAEFGDSIALASAPEGAGLFLGWTNASGDFLPAGASYTVTAEVTFSPVFVSFTTLSGASVRTNTGTTGLRFRSAIAQADYNALAALSGSVAFGTYIVPQSYVDQIGGFDVSKFPMHLDVSANGWYQTTETDFVIAGSVANIKTQNYQLAYTACAYVTFTYSDGTEVTVLAARAENRGYTVYEVAHAAYNDRTQESDAVHGFEIDDETGISYSPYTATQLRTIRTFIDPVMDLGIRNGRLVSLSDTAYYTSPLAECEWTYDEVHDRVVITAASADAWSSVIACYMDGDAVTFTADGATLYVAYVIYSDFY